jgi:hypothetical protein
MPLLPSPWHNNLAMMSRFWWLFRPTYMPIAMHLPVGQNLAYQLMCGGWHGLVKMAIKRHHHEQQCKATRRHPLSLVENVKIYFINNRVILVILTCN